MSASHTDLGVVWEQPAYLHGVIVSNDGEVPLTIVDVQGDCQCTSARAVEQVIPAKGTVPVELLLDLRESSPLPREFSSTLTFTLSEPGGARFTSTIPVKGRVERSPIAIAPTGSDDTPAVRGVPDTWERWLRVMADASIESVSAESLGSPLQAVELQAGPSATGHDLRVSLDPSLPLGPYRGLVKLSVRAANRDGEFFVPVRGRVVPDVQAYPPAITWGARPLGVTLSEGLVIRSRSGRSITQVIVRTVPDDATVVNDDSRSNSWARVFCVEARTAKLGNSNKTLSFDVLVEGEADPQSLEVPLSYYCLSHSSTSTDTSVSSQ